MHRRNVEVEKREWELDESAWQDLHCFKPSLEFLVENPPLLEIVEEQGGGSTKVRETPLLIRESLRNQTPTPPLLQNVEKQGGFD